MKERFFLTVVSGMVLAIILSTVFSCINKNRKETEKVVTEWIGKEIKFPEKLWCNILGKDTVSDLCVDLLRKQYKILLYVDSTGCSNCRLKLLEWKQLIRESDSIFHGQVGFLFFFQPKDKMEAGFISQQADFDYPLFIDVENTVGRLNHFPKQQIYQCFLLDENNKVLIIGNPVLNSELWNLYKSEICKNI
jgi:hypothetical protein